MYVVLISQFYSFLPYESFNLLPPLPYLSLVQAKGAAYVHLYLKFTHRLLAAKVMCSMDIPFLGAVDEFIMEKNPHSI